MTARLRTIARPLVLVAAGAFALAGCSSSLSADDVETQISDQLEAQVGQAPDEVSCPDDLPAEEGAEMTCVLTAEDMSLDVTVTVTSVDGNTVNFDIQVADEAN